VNEEALAQWGLLRQEEKKYHSTSDTFIHTSSGPSSVKVKDPTLWMEDTPSTHWRAITEDNPARGGARRIRTAMLCGTSAQYIN